MKKDASFPTNPVVWKRLSISNGADSSVIDHAERRFPLFVDF